MIALLQRVLSAGVTVGEDNVAAIDQGLLVFIAIERSDTPKQAQRLTERILGYRIFSDEFGKMNLSVVDVRGAVLFVPQFTLAADTQKGLRPSFSSACAPAEGIQLFNTVVDCAKGSSIEIQQGKFGAHMLVSLVNDGPVTFSLTCR